MNKTLIILAVCFSTSAFAANEPRHPTDKIAADLGVSEVAFSQCFKPERPDRNKRPDEAKMRAEKAKLLTCLQDSNPSMTGKRLDSVMERYRPEPPKRGS
ncbi:hypothetical protein [Cohaesibacter celericrescens]|uniref:hypothetical protein n=1 Tax=Cohaesibacter celericrescens TaxID=2067669 RepID=UPI003564993F